MLQIQEAVCDAPCIDATYRFTLTDEGDAAIVGCEPQSATVEIPAMLGGHAVTVVGDEAFARSAGTAGVPGASGFNRNALGASVAAFGSNRASQVERVVIPEGVTSIGRAAFRGCSRLAEIVLPESLEEIGDLAFSCSAVKSIRLPKACVRLSKHALRLGPGAQADSNAPYRSRLARIDVAPENPRYVMRGQVLCERMDQKPETLVAILCPSEVDLVDFTCDVARIAPSAFAGTNAIEEMRISSAIEFDPQVGLFSGAYCKRLTIVDDASGSGASCLTIDMPDRQSYQRIAESTIGSSTLDVRKLLAAYDEALVGMKAGLERAQLMLARLAQPVCLTDDSRVSFESYLSENLDAALAHFGARGMWQCYDQLVEAGVLTTANVAHAIDVASALSDTASIGYLLELKRTRLQAEAWDYGL